MQVLQISVIVLIGLSLGVASSLARIPEVKWIPLLAATVLACCSYVGLWVLWDISLIGALLFLASVFVGSALYGGRLWQKLGLEPGLSYWEWVKRDFIHTRYLRRLYRDSGDRDSGARNAGAAGSRVS